MGVNLEDTAFLAHVTAYVAATGLTAAEGNLTAALLAEAGDQSNRCRVPAEHEDYMVTPLLEALCRRVAHNLAVRPLPLGAQMLVTDAAAVATPVGGHDPEVRRLEGPYRRKPIG